MILNLSNGGSYVQYLQFTQNTQANELVINNVQVPGGVVKGFALIKSGSNYNLSDSLIFYAYAYENLALSEDFVIGALDTDSGQIISFNTLNTAYGFEYDSQNQTLTLTPYDSLSPAAFFYGSYVLFIW